MEFQTALRILDRSTGEAISGRFPGRLERMATLLRLLGNPERKFASVHVGGTAGKGSTATMCAAILSEAGYRVGLHTKPHLHSVTERARIGNVPITEERFGEVFERLASASEEMRATEWGSPSYFELLVALAFTYFAEEAVDVAVIEVGVGGLLDGTNLIVPKVSVITNVGTDHKDVLGDTVEQIAKDKAGIIKEGVPVVTAAEQPSVLRIIEDAARDHAAPLISVQTAASVASAVSDVSYAQSVRVQTPDQLYEFTLPLIGEFQATNAATAILACEQIRNAFPFTSQDVSRSLGTLSLPGRTEYYPSRPALLFDVAHNVEKAAALRGAIERHFPQRRLVFVVAIAEDKDGAGVIAAWRGLPAQYIFTTFDVSHRKSRHARSLVNIAEDAGMVSRAVDDPIEALNLARRIASGGDLVIVTGSTFLVGTLRRWFLENSAVADRAGV
ncbi:MAG TPA: folylpolyglutamate synthase/dihydrofolate synthase family protein [Candidatus Acidoferrales bacterium]|nr:folylpolyglutamate synthase/dihydrofolate synthase family protein [Candidatus Acidoferrales bacterium]